MIIDLSEVFKPEKKLPDVFEKLNVVVKEKHNRDSPIYVTCPRCGERGTLVPHSRGAIVRYAVVHDRRTKRCTFSPSSEGYDELRFIHRFVREGKYASMVV
ncbi:MAG TPA: hypothetical protein ENI25_01100 [Epsilonproteobacteria bacterium]|nr:hypothetical protein [Campylobacterota bacterium]